MCPAARHPHRRGRDRSGGRAVRGARARGRRARPHEPWVSHFRAAPRHLTVLGMNDVELARNPHAATVIHDLNADPRLPFPDASFDDVVCCVSVDYLVHPIEVFRDVAACSGRAVASCARSRTAAFPPRRSVGGSTHPMNSGVQSSRATSARLGGGSRRTVCLGRTARRGPQARSGQRPLVRGLESLGTLHQQMKAFQRGLLVAAIAAAVSVVVRVRGKGRVPPTTGGWRELQGPDFR